MPITTPIFNFLWLNSALSCCAYSRTIFCRKLNAAPSYSPRREACFRSRHLHEAVFRE